MWRRLRSLAEAFSTETGAKSVRAAMGWFADPRGGSAPGALGGPPCGARGDGRYICMICHAVEAPGPVIQGAGIGFGGATKLGGGTT